MIKFLKDFIEIVGMFLLIIVIIIVGWWDDLVEWWKLPPMPKNNLTFQWA